MSLQGAKVKEWKKVKKEEINNFYLANIEDFNKNTEYFYCRFPYNDTFLWENKVIKQLSRKDIENLCKRNYIYLRKQWEN